MSKEKTSKDVSSECYIRLYTNSLKEAHKNTEMLEIMNKIIINLENDNIDNTLNDELISARAIRNHYEKRKFSSLRRVREFDEDSINIDLETVLS